MSPDEKVIEGIIPGESEDDAGCVGDMDEKKIICLVLGYKYKQPLQGDGTAHNDMEAHEAR